MAKSKNRRKKNYTTTKNNGKNGKFSYKLSNGVNVRLQTYDKLPPRSEKDHKEITTHSAHLAAIMMLVGRESDTQQEYLGLGAAQHNMLYMDTRSKPSDWKLLCGMWIRNGLIVERGIPVEALTSEFKEYLKYWDNNFDEHTPAFQDVIRFLHKVTTEMASELLEEGLNNYSFSKN